MASLRLTSVLGAFNRIHKNIVLTQKSEFNLQIFVEFIAHHRDAVNFGLGWSGITLVI